MSLGASCVLDFAIAYPEKISRLVLCSPGMNGWQDVMRLILKQAALYPGR